MAVMLIQTKNHHPSLLLWVVLVGLALTTTTTLFLSTRHGDGDLTLETAAYKHPAVVLRFHLRQYNLEKLEQRLYEISDPSHDDYGQWMTLDDLTKWIAPPKTELTEVLSWIKTTIMMTDDNDKNDVLDKDTMQKMNTISIAPTKDSIVVRHSDLKIVRRVFGSQLNVRQRSSSEDPKRIHSVSSPQVISIPNEIASFVDLITVGSMEQKDDKSSPRRQTKSVSSILKSDFEGKDVTPDVIYKTYNLNMTTGLDDDTILASQTAAEFEEAYFYEEDVRLFEHQYNLPEQNVTKIIGKNTPDEGYLGEASLDVQYLIAAAPGVPTWVISLYEFDLASWVDEILKYGDDAPKVHSVSWGSAEMEYHEDWVYRMNIELMKLALMGHSVLVASGDEGAGNAGLGILCKRFQPAFPATSPFVTVRIFQFTSFFSPRLLKILYSFDLNLPLSIMDVDLYRL